MGTVANPAASTHFNYLQTVALNVPGVLVQKTVDATAPDEAWLADPARQQTIDAFREAFELHDAKAADALANGGAKRQRTTSSGAGAAPKKEKAGIVMWHPQSCVLKCMFRRRWTTGR